MSRVLVTGGAGYIGSFAVQALLRAGHDVIVFDNLSQGHAEAVQRLAAAEGGNGRPNRLTFVQGDIRELDRLRETLVQHRANAVMHFAALLLVAESVKHPIGYYDNNVGGALSVLRAMVEAGVDRFIFSSTCATFGEPQAMPMAEDHPQRPINAYGETKLAIEQALPHYERAYGFKSVVLRYFNAAGADPDELIGEDHDPEVHLIPRAIDAVLGGEPLAIFGDDYPTPDGTCLRDYVHVADLADAHVRALGRLEEGGASAHYNLGTGTPNSVREILTAVERVSGRPVPHSVQPRRPGDPAALYAANTKVRRELGWEPRVTRLDQLVDTAWRWRCRHPQGYRSVAQPPKTTSA